MGIGVGIAVAVGSGIPAGVGLAAMAGVGVGASVAARVATKEEGAVAGSVPDISENCEYIIPATTSRPMTPAAMP